MHAYTPFTHTQTYIQLTGQNCDLFDESLTKSRPIIRKSFSVLFNDHRGHRKSSIHHHLDINTFFLASFVHMKWIDMHSKITIQISDSGMEASHHRCMPQRNNRIWITETGKWMDGWCVFSCLVSKVNGYYFVLRCSLYICLCFSLFVPWMRHGIVVAARALIHYV